MCDLNGKLKELLASSGLSAGRTAHRSKRLCEFTRGGNYDKLRGHVKGPGALGLSMHHFVQVPYLPREFAAFSRFH